MEDVIAPVPPAFGMALVLALAPARGDEPAAELLRMLAGDDDTRDAACTRLVEDPSLLLAAIFVPPEADAPDPELIRRARRLIPELADERYPVRVAAEEELRQAGPGTRPALREALDDPSPEIRLRARSLIDGFRHRPALADLDYGRVGDTLSRAVGRIESDARIEMLAREARRRLGEATVHGQEVWLLRPIYEELCRRDTAAAPEILRGALDSPFEGFAESVATAASETAARKGLSHAYLTVLGVRDPALLGHALMASPRFEPDARLALKYRDALQAIVADSRLPESCRLRAHRPLLLLFERGESLAAILKAGLEGEEEITTLVLGDPRLIGLPLEGALEAAGLAEHPSPEVRTVAAGFLLTRPEADCIRQGIRMLPGLEQERFDRVRKEVRNLFDPSTLRRELQQEIDRKGPAAGRAEALRAALPQESLPMPAAEPTFPFRFR